MRVKYPRTPHLPWSPGATNDDKVLKTTSHFVGKKIVMTEKFDGECTTMYNDCIHARSLDSANHPSRNWVKQFWASIRHDIPEDFRICGENLYAQHSIRYDGLLSYFYGFSMWNGKNDCLAWDETVFWFDSLGIHPVRVIYIGLYDEDFVKNYKINDGQEGYVIRSFDSFSYDDFQSNIAKYVRPNHVQTDDHWMNKPITPNGLISVT